MTDAVLTPDGETLLFLARYDEGFDLWKYAHRTKELERLAKLDARRAGALQLDTKGKKAFLVADRRLMTVEVGSGKATPVALSATMKLDADAERAYMFEHAWRQTYKKFLVEDMHGVDWPAMKAYYQQFLPSIHTNWELAELLSEMLGELNASHTGAGYRPDRDNADSTASLAFFPDPEHTGDGIKVEEIIEGSPLEQADSKIEPGVVITAIDGTEIAAGMNWYPLLDRKADTRIRLTLQHDDDTWEETVKPISQRELGQLLYERWVRSRRAEVERLSDGRLGYAHIRGMNDRSYREIFEDIFGESVGAEGIVLDTRFNSGGNLVEALTTLLSGEVYATAVPRGQVVGVDPSSRWTKPSIVVMNEGNYSDAHCFPKAYTDLELGETVGMQVPGTCTAVWWERLLNNDLYFGIPQVGYLDHNGEILENQHLDPDHEVDNDPALEAAGRDQQLEKAVEVLLAEIDG
jgi:C-terminal processing protease CtpA/Prc